MNVLLIDTTTKDLVIAIVQDNNVIDGSIANLGTKHSETLCNAVAQLLNSANLTFDDIDAYACSIGPGSFTGIRIGISTVKGYALAKPAKLLALQTLQAIAFSDKCGRCGSAIIDAGNGYYYADYVNGVEPCLISYDDNRAQFAGKAQSATEYLDGLVQLVRQFCKQGSFADSLQPLYIRRSQAEEHK